MKEITCNKNNRKNIIRINSEKGVTLSALVVTIIVLLILAGVAISLAIGNNGIFTRAKNAADKWQEASDTEQSQLDDFAKLYDNTVKDLNIGDAGSGEGGGTTSGDGGGGTSGDVTISREEYNALLERVAKLENDNIERSKKEPTGYKQNASIKNVRNVKTEYTSLVTTTNGWTRSTDSNNNIAEYLTYSSTDGYVVQKEGWYFVNIIASLEASSTSSVDLTAALYLNGTAIMQVRLWTDSNGTDRGAESDSIYLRNGDKIYFGATANGANASRRDISGIVHPMF